MRFRGDIYSAKGIITCVIKPLFPVFALLSLTLTPLCAEFVWLEAEDAAKQSLTEHDWYGNFRDHNVSGGDLAHHWDKDKPGKLSLDFEVTDGGEYTLWLRANPTQTTIRYQLNGGPEQTVPDDVHTVGVTNVAGDAHVDLRFLTWMDLGPVQLKRGSNEIAVTFDSKNHHHGMLDVVLLTNERFVPRGKLKPGETVEAPEGWQVWDPPADNFGESAIDLRWLNQERAGQDGRVLAKDGHFYFEKTGEPVRFWAVNGPSIELRGEDLQAALRQLAKRGVNLLRYHSAVFNSSTGVYNDKKRVGILAQANEAEQHGIYVHLSVYFPLWFRPAADLDWLKGYDGKKRAFVSLMFNEAFEKRYQEWWRELLTKPDANGRRLIDHPALMSVELQNEDSFFFWTFKYEEIPEPQMAILEGLFYDWAIEKYGSVDQTYAAWNGLKIDRDQPDQKRLAFRPIYQTYEKRTTRDFDTIRFLYEQQRGFYERQRDFLRNELGFKGLITCGNWRTTSPEFLDPIENLSYFPGDFIDRHGAYFGTQREGRGASWSIREDHAYGHRSALKMEPQKADGNRQFSGPIWSIQYNDYPSMISETNFTRLNQYRGESQLYYATFGALQDIDSIVHFNLSGTNWSTQQFVHVDPWTMMTPTQVGQFPAAALIYRQGLIKAGPVLADVQLKESDLFQLKGTPLAPRGNLDLLRQADMKFDDKDGGAISPLIHYIGRAKTVITTQGGVSRVDDLTPYIDLEAETVRSATGEVDLDFGDGILTVDAPQAQIVMGDLSQRQQAVVAGQFAVDSPMETLYTALVSLDGKPIAESGKLLLQVMTQEEPTGFESERADNGLTRIKKLGRDPWLYLEPQGTVFLKRADAAQLKVTPLDLNGYPQAGKSFTGAKSFKLRPDAVYYLIEK